MKKEVCVFLADGFEEIEGLTVVDLLRRAGITVKTVSVTKDKVIKGAHQIQIHADALFEEMSYRNTDMLVLPGGMPGTKHLEEHRGLEELLKEFYKEEKYIAAICAAPSILGKLGMLEGRTAVSYPSKEEELFGADVRKKPVAVDGHIITSRGLGTAIEFSLTLIGLLIGRERAQEIQASIVYEVKKEIVNEEG